MASLISCCATSLTWCFCSACTSLLGDCCGNDKPSSVPPSATSGRKRSVLVICLSIILSLGFQYGVAPALVDSTIDNFVRDNWLDGCEDLTDVDLQKSCAGNNGNYRVAAASTLFFILAALAAFCKPTANREAWPAKYILYLFLVAVTIVIPNKPLFADIFLNIARIGGIIFILVQQLAIIDLAYNWNERWVTRADSAEAEEPGSGKKWLGAILVSCIILFLVSIVGIGLMFAYFTGCTSNNGFIAVTLVLCIAITVAQLSGEEGSLLSSACVSAWATFLCYTAVSKNPDGECNPRLGEYDPLNIAFGLTMTFLSLSWAAWSNTAEDKLVVAKKEETSETSNQNDEEEAKKVTGVVTGGTEEKKEEEKDEAEEEVNPRKLSNSWRLNIALATVACWASMILTGWGAIQSNGDIANPSVNRIGMWMVIAAQWLVLTLYLWTLVAPKLFPGRDFS